MFIFRYLKSSYLVRERQDLSCSGALCRSAEAHLNVTPGEKGQDGLGFWDDRHRQNFSTRACPSTLDSGIPSYLWVFTVIIFDTQSELMMFEKIRHCFSHVVHNHCTQFFFYRLVFTSGGVGVVNNQKRKTLQSSENSVIPLTTPSLTIK